MSRFAPPCAADQVASLHADFLAILPTIERHARFVFRSLHRYHDREDAVQETVAIAWAWYVQLARQGKDASAFPSALASYAALHVKSGRHLLGTKSTKDVFSPIIRHRRGCAVERLSDDGTFTAIPWQDALIDNRQSPIPNQVIFRMDFPAWLDTLDERDRQLAEAMTLGHRTLDLARSFGVSPSRVSQLRRKFHRSWRCFRAASGKELPRDPVTAA